MSIPVDAIDPTATARRWSEKFTYHLDLIPVVLEAIVETTLPALGVSRGGSRFDRPQVTGGGYQDTMSAMLAVFDQSGRADGIQPSAAVKDARELWSWLVEYTNAVDAWIAPTRPAPTLASRPDADPLTARALALPACGWLIDHADTIHTVTELDEHSEAMFTEIRRLRGRYGVTPRPRTPREMCTTCGRRDVVAAWASDPSGSPKPIRVARCRSCGETWRGRP